MQASTISASSIKIDRWDNPKKLTDGIGIELSAAGLHCVCFDTGKEAALSAKAEISSDLLSTVIPANLKLVKNPFGNSREAYHGNGLVPVLQNSKSVATYFVDGFLTPAQKEAASDQIEDLAVADPSTDP